MYMEVIEKTMKNIHLNMHGSPWENHEEYTFIHGSPKDNHEEHTSQCTWTS